ncbi:hypothetical protein MKW94_020338 [Papaver nudicaule]|uniref:Vacuolar iron transporter n=1 Tax=Papaver nudicaule TaxID=74823 RepID=A0AA41SLN1_PAPNU|nr:hypothetical protein [Papaver nudicaule]
MKPMLENKENEEDYIDYTQRALWLQPSVLGLVSIASLMMGVGGFYEDANLMFFAGLIGLIAGACSHGIREYGTLSSQIKGDNVANKNQEAECTKKEKLPNPFKAAGASAIAFSLGAMVPLLAAAAAAAAVRDHNVRLGVVAGATSLALLGFGGLEAVLRKVPLLNSSLRVLVGGWIAMGITFGLTTLIGTSINRKF